MAYTPPHKRHSKDSNKSAPIPRMLVPIFKRNLYRPPGDRSWKIVYADQAISRWFAVGLDENNQIPSSVHLEPVSVKSFERRSGENPLVLMNGNLGKVAEKAEVSENVLGSQWGFIAENVWQDLLSSFRNARNDKDIKSSLVARFGKILFHGCSVGLESAREGPVTEPVLRQLKRAFNGNVPKSYAEEVSNELVTEVGFEFEGEKDIYQVKLSDRKKPDCTISCKCIVNEDRSLELYKVEINPVRHMVVDLSCVDKNLDLRLALCTKKVLTDLANDEMQSIMDIITAAIIDPDVKGGLRWPLGRSYSDRCNVVGACHTVTKSYRTESLRLKVRQADQFDFKAARGDASVEVILLLKRVALKILEEKTEPDSIFSDFKDNLKLIWDYFMCCKPFLPQAN